MRTIYDVLTDAINDFEEHGFDSETRLNRWLEEIRHYIDRGSSFTSRLDAQFREKLRAIFDRLVDKEKILSDHPQIGKFTLRNIKHRLHAELDRRIVANANLIKFNRTEAINKTLQRFSGWATSVPKENTGKINKKEIKEVILKPIAQLPYNERRVLIDQGHKLNSSISAVIASDGGAIAARWFSNWKQTGYDFRDAHKERDGKIYLIRSSWAQIAGFVKQGEAGFSDQITQPCEEPFCRCKFVYLYNLRQLPEDMLTRKGKDSLDRIKGL